MPERPLNSLMRALLGIVGATSLVAGAAIAAVQLRSITRGAALSTLLLAAIAILVAASGAYIIRGAIRGRIVVRRTGTRRR
jgi:hypothetical protein